MSDTCFIIIKTVFFFQIRKTNHFHMSEHTLLSLTKKIYSENLLNCALCKEICSIPSRLVNNVGNVCNVCYTLKHSQTNKWIGIPNTLLDTIITTINIPCKYNSAGCTMMLEYGKLKFHEQQCLFRTIPCTFFKATNCVWKGLPNDFSCHLIEEHSCSIVNTERGDFEFRLNFAKLSNKYPLIKILKSVANTFILKMDKCINENSTLIYTIYDGRMEPEDDKQQTNTIIMKHIYGDSELKKRCKILSLHEITSDIICLKVNLSSLTSTDNFNDIVTIKIKPDADFGPKLRDFADQLECSVCSEMAPIYMCK